MKIELTSIGTVHNSVKEPLDDIWGGLESTIELEGFPPEALAGLGEYSHVEVVFHFHRLPESEVIRDARHPRNRTDWPKVGIFAQRAKRRPNRIGVTVCRLLAVEGTSLRVEGLDAIDGTPVLDIKPYVREFGPKGEVRQPKWATELMQGYWKKLK